MQPNEPKHLSIVVRGLVTYDHNQAVMVAWRLFREAIAHRLTPSSITSACP